MYTLPDDFNEQIFLGCYLEMICFGSNVTKFHFSKPQTASNAAFEITVVSESAISFGYDDRISTGYANDSLSIAPVLALLMRDVTNVIRSGRASLQISFEPDGYLTLDGDTSPDFEAYTIYVPSGEIIVI
jgi:hypothetical protein